MRTNILAGIIVFGALWAGLMLASCQNPSGNYTGEKESVTIGMEPTAVNGLVYIAESQGLFALNGLDVTVRIYSSGLAAVNGMLSGQVDAATAAEFVIVGKAFVGEKIQAFATIDKFSHNYVLGRRDRGIVNATDLKGKKIGVPLKTAAEFYLGRFLDLRGMSIKQVTLQDVPPGEIVDALVGGEVDAVAAWQPNAQIIQDRLGSGIVKWPAQNAQATYCAIVSAADWAEKHPALVKRLLSSLVQAEKYVTANPDEAWAILQDKLGYDNAYTAVIRPEHQLSVSLDQSLILAMEDEARWMIKNRLTSNTETPDFLDYVHVDGLEAVKPAAVHVIR